MTASTTNLHFHGLSIPPTCHQDDVLSTLVQPSESGYEYRFKFRRISRLVCIGIIRIRTALAKRRCLAERQALLSWKESSAQTPKSPDCRRRVIVLRDQMGPGTTAETGDAEGPEPSKDISIDFVPILHPENAPAAMVAKPNQREFWRILNAAADTYFDIQVLTGPSLREASVPLPLELVAMDGAPAGRDPDPRTLGHSPAARSAGRDHLDYAARRSVRPAGHASLRYRPGR